MLVAAWYGQGNGWQASNNNLANGPIHYKWMDAIYPFVKSTGVFHCPDDSGGYPINGVNGAATGASSTGTYVPVSQYDTPGNPASPNEAYYGSYAINSYNYNGGAPDIGPGNNLGQAGYTLATLQSPATCIWVVDGGGAYQMDSDNKGLVASTWGGQPDVQSADQSPGPIDGNPVVFRHGAPDLLNVLFCDGHVKAMRQATLLSTNANGFFYYFTMRGL